MKMMTMFVAWGPSPSSFVVTDARLAGCLS